MPNSSPRLTRRSPERGPGLRVAIIGAGVIGLATGWRLAASGATVDVFDRGEAGHGASWAAAGMLAAGLETEPGEEGLLDLTLRSQRLWPAFAHELEAASGVDLGYRSEGTLAVALTRDDMAQLRFTFDFQRDRLGLDLAWLTREAVLEREPQLHPGTVAAIYSPRDHQVDNRRLVVALRAALAAAGGRLHEHVEARLETKGTRVADVVALGDGRHQRVAADVVVLAAGAWSGEVEGVPAAARPPVRPVKGQMLALRMPPTGGPLLSHVVWAPKAYLIPRRDGRLLVGATVEERGFDDRLTAGGVLSLLDGAWRAVPAIEELPIEEMWTGFRPGSRDDAPMLGPAPAVDGLVIATGHYRNGILLTPVTADAIARLVLAGETPPEIRPFAPDRFAAGQRVTRGQAAAALDAGA